MSLAVIKDNHIFKNVDYTLESVKVTNGEGIGEGAFELRIEVLEVGQSNELISKAIWPGDRSTKQVKKDGTPMPINRPIGTYPAGPEGWNVWKTFVIKVTEEDTGTLGQDEFGSGQVRFDFSEAVCKTTESAKIPLSVGNKTRGEVQVNILAQPA